MILHFKRSYLLVIVILCLVLTAGCGRTNQLQTVRGSGNITTETRDVSAFSKIDLMGTGNIIITIGDTPSLTIEAEDNIMEYLETTVSNDRLTLDVRDHVSLYNSKPITYRMTMSNLSEVKISGGGSVTADSLDGDNLHILVDGTVTITLSGTMTSQTIEINGTANYDGEDLATQNTTTTINGNGDLTVNATDTLNVTINGTGNVRYTGDPQVTKTINGTGSVTSR